MASVTDILEELGRSAARAHEIQGALYGGLASNLGAIPGQVIQARTQAADQAQQRALVNQRLQAGALQIAGAQREQANQSALDRVWASGIVNPDGSVDLDKARAQMEQSGQGHLFPQFVDQANRWDESRAKLIAARTAAKEATLKLQETQQDHLGLDAARLDPTNLGDFHAFVASKAGDGSLDRVTADRLLQTVQTPDQVKTQYAQWMDQSPTLQARLRAANEERLKGLKEVPKEGKIVDVTKISPTTGQAAVIAEGAPATPPAAQHTSFLLDGKPVMGAFVPDKTGEGGKYLYNGEDVTARVRPMPPASVQVLNQPAAQTEIHTQARMLAEGDILPSQMSRRSSSYNAIIAEADKISRAEHGKPLDLQKLELDYRAANRFVGSMNGPQQIRFRSLADSVVNTIDEVKSLAEELQQGGIQKWNQAKRSTILQVYGNTPQSDTAVRYVAAVNTLKEEYASLAQGGYAPTEPAWKLADQQINGDYGVKDLNASLAESQRLIKYRLAGLQNQAPQTLGGPAINPMTPTGPTVGPIPPAPSSGPPTPTHRYNPATGKIEEIR